MDLQVVEAATATLAAAGVRVLSPWWLGATEPEHARALLSWLNPPPGARVLDAGCGTGEVARLMAAERPDLDFTLLNVSGAQLAMAPDWMTRVCRAYDRTELPDHTFDQVLFSQSIEHAPDLGAVLREAARVTRYGGTVAIFGMLDCGHDAARLRARRARP